MSNYIGLVLCTDGILGKTHRFMHISEGDLIEIDGERHTVQAYITVNIESEEYDFICQMHNQIYMNDIHRVEAILRKTVLEYEEDENV